MSRQNPREYRERLLVDAEFRERAIKKRAPILVRNVIDGAIAHGAVDPKGKTGIQILQEVLGRVNDPKWKGKLRFAIDHTDTLRRLASEMGDAGHTEIQGLLLATWVEHVLNELVSAGAARKGLADATIRQIIRDVPLSAKLGWLLPLLGLGALSPTRVPALLKLADIRNQFVHYKWTYTDGGREKDSGDATQRAIEKAREPIKYLAQYRARQLHLGTKKKVKRAIVG
jgi:hypothetical protein